jgi:hypothetical protein
VLIVLRPWFVNPLFPPRGRLKFQRLAVGDLGFFVERLAGSGPLIIVKWSLAQL